jgi:hypothetical protein
MKLRPASGTSAVEAVAAAATASIVTLKKRDGSAATSCVTRSLNGPQVTDPADSDNAFLAYPGFTSAAENAAIPSGYALVPEFQNLQAAASDSHYMTYTSQGLTTYDPSVCAAACNAMQGCTSFNIFYQRTPLIVNPDTLAPDDTLCPADSSSPSTTLLQCAFYGTFLEKSMATNVGQYWGTFHLVIAGSNAYVKTSAPTLAGYEGPVSFNNAAINAPAPVNEHGYLRAQTFGQNVPFDPSLCAASCEAQSDYNAAHPDLGLGQCVFFNVYVLEENGANGVLTCTYFSTPYGTEFATMTGQYDQESNFFGVTSKPHNLPREIRPC